jgi:hypothetical protein
LNFFDRLSKNPQILNFMKIYSVGAELFYANRRADSLTKLIVSFHNIYNFCTYFSTHHVFCPMQHCVTIINYRGGEFLLLGKTRVFKEKGLRFVVNRLNYFCKVSHVTGPKMCCLTFHNLLHIWATSFFHCLVLTFREKSTPTQVANLAG